MYLFLKRLFDFSLALIILFWGLPFLLVLYVALKLRNDSGPVIHWSKRIGQNRAIFLMPKFRTMKCNTPQVATHLLGSAESYLTNSGAFLRKSSLDEVPQLYSILVGDMSFVGPRPALFNQDDLMELREKYDVDKLKPGLTGWAQINGRDDLPVAIKVDYEKEYDLKKNFLFDLKILCLTFFKVLKQDNIQH